MTRDEMWEAVRFIALGFVASVALGFVAVAVAIRLFSGLFT